MNRALVFSIVGLALVGCSLSRRTLESADAEPLAVGQKEALPITGSWVTTQLWGFKKDSFGNLVRLNVTKAKLDKNSWKVEFDLNSEGNGVILGRVLCSKVGNKIEGIDSNLSGSRVLMTANGIVGGIHLIASFVEIGRCMVSDDGFIDTVVPVSRASYFFGQPHARIDRNLGFVGEATSSTAADNECRRLRGVRYINMNRSTSCIGFRDAKANQIRFIGVPLGAVHAIRVDFERQ